jgi:membrane protein
MTEVHPCKTAHPGRAAHRAAGNAAPAGKLSNLAAVMAGSLIGMMLSRAIESSRENLASRRGEARLAAHAPAAAPLRPVHGIWPIIKRTWSEFSQDRVPAVSAGVTFFILLALFPGIASVVSLYRLVGDPNTLLRDLSFLAAVLPGGAITVLREEITRLIAQPPAVLGVSFVTGLAIALWSASGGVKALIDGLNIAYEVRERRGLVKLSLTALLFTAIAIVFLLGVLLLATVVPDAITRFTLGPNMQFVLQILLWPLAYFLCVFLLALVYRFAPNRPYVKWRWITWGSAITSAAWIGGTVLFSWYVQNYGSYDRTYGALGAAVGFLTWIWLSLVIMLAGAELNFELDRSEPAPVTATHNHPAPGGPDKT